MDEHFLKEDIFKILRLLSGGTSYTQRQLSSQLGVSLGKINYLLKELIKKGFIKVKNFSKDKNKSRKIKYILTEKGLEERIKLTYSFLKRKEKEYRELKRELMLIQRRNKNVGQ